MAKGETSYSTLLEQKPVSSVDLKSMGVWWWRDLGSGEITPVRSFWIHNNFESVWERSAFLYELSARFEGEYEFGKPWAFLKLREHSLVHSRWEKDPICRVLDEWKKDLRAPIYKRVDDLTEIYGRKEGWTHPLSFNLSYETEELITAFRHRIEAIKAKMEEQGQSLPQANSLWQLVELIDKSKLGKPDAVQENEHKIIEKVTGVYHSTRESQKGSGASSDAERLRMA